MECHILSGDKHEETVVCVWVSEKKRKWKSLSHVRLFVTPMDYTVQGILQARRLEWDLQGIFPT